MKRILPELAFISLGSNIEPEFHLPKAIEHISNQGVLLSISSVYQNPAIGGEPQPDFFNVAALLETEHSAEIIFVQLREIEADLGRVRTEDKYAARIIDLDLSLLGTTIFSSPEITLPDPDILVLAHIAVPLAELRPDFVHPISGEPLSEIANRLRPGTHFTPRPDVSEALRASLEGLLP